MLHEPIVQVIQLKKAHHIELLLVVRLKLIFVY